MLRSLSNIRAFLTCRLTERSWKPHLPVPITYRLQKAGESTVCTKQTMEYMPTERPLKIPEIDISNLPLESTSSPRVLFFIPTYSSREYILERIVSIYKQCQQFPTNWCYEIMVVLNGTGQQELWEHLRSTRETKGLSAFLSLAYIAREENPGMLQSKITPMNIAIARARERNFDVFCCVDDDTWLSPGTLRKSIEFLQQQTLQEKAPVMTGPEIRFAPPRTFFEKILTASRLRNLLIKGCCLLLWTPALPHIPVDAGNEDFLLNWLYGKRAKFFEDEESYGIFRVGSTFTNYIRQNFRLKWNDSAATQCLGEAISLWKYLLSTIHRLNPPVTIFSKQGICHFIIRTINLYVYVHVKLSILLRNILNLPRGTVDWVGTVDKNTKGQIDNLSKKAHENI